MSNDHAEWCVSPAKNWNTTESCWLACTQQGCSGGLFWAVWRWQWARRPVASESPPSWPGSVLLNFTGLLSQTPQVDPRSPLCWSLVVLGGGCSRLCRDNQGQRYRKVSSSNFCGMPETSQCWSIQLAFASWTVVNRIFHSFHVSILALPRDSPSQPY